MEKKYFTAEGFERVKEELQYLETIRRKQVAARIKRALEQGDLSENAEYAEAKEEQAFVEGRVLELKEKIRNAKIIKKNDGLQNKGVVILGSTLVVKSNLGKQEITIVGSTEANPAKGRISNESPIGKAFLGHVKGEQVAVRTPGGDQSFKILEVK